MAKKKSKRDEDVARYCECGVEEGQLHEFGCRMEVCPFCEQQFAVGCGCPYEFLGLRTREFSPHHSCLSTKVYKGGLTDKQNQRWLAILTAKGRLPFVYVPVLCGRCGKLWPDLFVVQDAVREYYLGPSLRKQQLCEPCFHELRINIDKYQRRPDWLPPEAEILLFIKAWSEGDQETMQRLDPEKFEPYRRPVYITGPLLRSD